MKAAIVLVMDIEENQELDRNIFDIVVAAIKETQPVIAKVEPEANIAIHLFAMDKALEVEKAVAVITEG